MDLTNNYLGGNVIMSVGQTVIYGTGINETVMNMIAYWNEAQPFTACVTGAGIADEGDEDSVSIPSAKPGSKGNIGFNFAPNPAGPQVMVRMSELDEAQEIVLEVYNSLGQQLLRKEFGKANYLSEEIDISGLGNGLYIVSVKAGGERFEQKLVISKD